VLSIVSSVGSWGIVVLNFSSLLTCSVSLFLKNNGYPLNILLKMFRYVLK
jgi:hypothetical protein